MSASYRPLSTSPRSSTSGSSRRSQHANGTSLRALELDDDGSGDSPKRPGRHTRSSTVTSFGGFDFRDNILPLAPSGDNDLPGAQGEVRHVSMWHGMGLIMGTQVGSGIFASPGVVVAEVGSVGASLLVWVLSAGLAWTGASSFTELGCAIPLSGGAQAYLAYSFGPLASYLYTWTAVSTIKPGSSAIISLIFGEYINRMIYHAATGDVEAVVPEWTFKVTAVIAIISVSALNLLSRSSGTNSSVVITAVKASSLVFVGVLGVYYLVRNGANPSMSPSHLFDGTSHSPSSYAIALYSTLFAFDGWDACCFVAGEMKDTHRDLPRALHSSMTLVLLLFLSANISYFIVLDPATVASTNTVALDFGRVILGRAGAIIFSILVSISCFGALNASFYTTARLIYASSRDHFLPTLFHKLNARRGTPDYAIALQAGLTTFFVVFGGGFRRLLNFFSVTSWSFYLLSVLGLLVLRVKEPHLDRPYKAWISTPIIFCVVSMFLLLMPIFAAPLEGLAALMFISVGVPMYYLTAPSRLDNRSRVEDGSGIRGTCRAAWTLFREDLAHIWPSRWGGGEKIIHNGREPTFNEESHSMLRNDVVEMSER